MKFATSLILAAALVGGIAIAADMNIAPMGGMGGLPCM